MRRLELNLIGAALLFSAGCAPESGSKCDSGDEECVETDSGVLVCSDGVYEPSSKDDCDSTYGGTIVSGFLGVDRAGQIRPRGRRLRSA